VPYALPPVVPAGRLSSMAQPVLAAGGEFVLRPWDVSDAGVLLDAAADPAIQKWHKWRLDNADEARGSIEGWQRAWQEEREAHWAVARRADDVLVGRMALIGLRLARGVAEVAYWTPPWARGLGVAPVALSALSEFAFSGLGFHRLELVHSVANQASCRVAAKVGYALEGTMRGQSPHDDGIHDAHLHARIAGDA
jgi:RimJ/RimL family protein N-acetyltransferase